MLRHLEDRRGPADSAARTDQIGGPIGRPADLAGVAVLVFRLAFGAYPADEPVGQGHVAFWAPGQVDGSFGNRAGVFKASENQFAEVFIFRRVRGIIVIETYKKTCEILQVFPSHSVNKLLRRYAFLSCANHYRCAMGVIGTEIQAVIAAELLEPDPDVGLAIFDYMTYMYRGVCVRQG
jgi:hypothetical protein